MYTEERRTKRRRLGTPETDSFVTTAPKSSGTGELDVDTDFVRRAAAWNLEQTYETQLRGRRQLNTLRLPIKTSEGKIQASVVVDEDEEDLWLESSESNDAVSAKPVEARVSQPSNVSQASVRRTIIQAKEDLARLAGSINEDPEERIGSLKALAEITSSSNPTIAQLGLVTQRAVYQNVIPGYRIRPLSEEETSANLTKDTRRLRNFEQGLVKNYLKYVQELTRLARPSNDSQDSEEITLASTAVSCACGLLNSAPHFNLRTELLNIVMSNLFAKQRSPCFNVCINSLQELFTNDEDGHASLEAVSMIAKHVKAKPNLLKEQILGLFLHLRLLSEFFGKGSDKAVQKEGERSRDRTSTSRKTREFRTKRQRKLLREQKAIQKEMKEADASVGSEERQQIQAEILKRVLAIYFRTLQAKDPSLMGPVLEGLARYAHLINQDFFGDILEALKDLIESHLKTGSEIEEVPEDISHSMTRELLLCVVTAFSLLHGQDGAYAASTLHLDLDYFISQLYQALIPVALNDGLEHEKGPFRLSDPQLGDHDVYDNANDNAKINTTTTSMLLLRALSIALSPEHRPNSAPPIRIAAFTKQLMTLSLNLPEKTAVALMSFIEQILKLRKGKVAGIWHTDDRRGDGVFDPLSRQIERSNPFAATVWEGELLRQHYCPKVQLAIRSIEKLIKTS